MLSKIKGLTNFNHMKVFPDFKIIPRKLKKRFANRMKCNVGFLTLLEPQNLPEIKKHPNSFEKKTHQD